MRRIEKIKRTGAIAGQQVQPAGRPVSKLFYRNTHRRLRPTFVLAGLRSVRYQAQKQRNEAPLPPAACKLRMVLHATIFLQKASS
jgi:hypothetical protein